jgi:hypothetical protein
LAVHDSFLQFVLSRKTVDDEDIDGEVGRFDFEGKRRTDALAANKHINDRERVQLVTKRATSLPLAACYFVVHENVVLGN